jgi:ketosteroid isomerase-like protein
MSQENVEILWRAVDAWNSDDFETWIDQYDPEVEWFALRADGGVSRAQGCPAGLGELQGRRGVTVRFDDVRDLGDSVLALGEIETTGRRSGLNVAREVAQLITYRNGKTVSVRDFG